MATEQEMQNWGTVSFNGEDFPVEGAVTYRQLAKWDNRIVFGDPSKDDDELRSTKVYSDFSGGLGILNEKEGADVGRYWFGIGLDTTHPAQLAIEPRITKDGGRTWANWYPLGAINGVYYASNGGSVYSFDPATALGVWTDTTKVLAHTPVSKCVEYLGKLYIPEGGNGYETWDGVNVAAGVATHNIWDFCIWDKRLVALVAGATTRRLDFYDGTTWTSPAGANIGHTGILGGVKIRSFFTRGDDPSIAVIAADRIWQYDPVGQQMIPSTVQFPKSSLNALGVEVWRAGENLNISSGMGVYAWSGPGGSVAPIGLDRDEGLPYEYVGKIADLEPTHNNLFALVRANNTNTGGHDVAGVPTDKGRNAVYAYNGIGWRCVFEHVPPTIIPPGAADTLGVTFIDSADLGTNLYYLFWGIGGYIYWMKIPDPYANPRELVREGVQQYQDTGYLITSWFDANMEHFQKIIDYFVVNVADVGVGDQADTSSAAVTVSYQLDTGLDAGTFTSAGGGWITDLAALYIVDFSVTRIRFKIALTRDNTSFKTPILDSLVMKYIKLPSKYGSWSFTIPLDFEGPWGPPDGSGTPRDAAMLKHDLDDLIATDQFLTFKHENNSYRARITSISGADGTAYDRRGARTVTVVETPLPAYTPF